VSVDDQVVEHAAVSAQISCTGATALSRTPGPVPRSRAAAPGPGPVEAISPMCDRSNGSGPAHRLMLRRLTAIAQRIAKRRSGNGGAEAASAMAARG